MLTEENQYVAYFLGQEVEMSSKTWLNKLKGKVFNEIDDTH